MRKLTTKRKLGLLLCMMMSLGACAAFASCDFGGGSTNESVQSEQNAPTSETTSEGQTQQFTITFDTMGGSEIEEMVVEANANAEKPDNPTKAGHIFKGWYLDLNNTADGAFMFDETPITSDITLYAMWQIRTYNVTFQDSEGNAVEGITGGTYNWGSTLAKPDETNLARDGYIIKWYTNSGDIWDFDNSRVVANTTLTYRYVTTKSSYNAADIAENFYPVFDKTITDPESCQEHYTEGAESVFYTYQSTKLQQVVLNVELSTLDYGSVTIKVRTTDKELDASKGADFGQLRAYIKTDVGGNVSYNDEPSSGFNPLFYYIQSTGVNKELCTTKDEDGWMLITFDLASLKLWNEATRLDSFAFGFVSNSCGVEIQSIVFNEVDKNAEYTVAFEDNIGNTLAETQTIKWNNFATKPAVPESTATHIYTGEWVNAAGEVFDFENSRIRGNVTLYPQYTVENKYSWSGAEVAADFRAVYNATTANPAAEVVTEGRSIFTYNNGAKGNSLEQVAIDNLNLTIGNYKYLTLKWRTVNYSDYSYANGDFARIRVYLYTDKGGSVYKNNLDGKDSYYIDFTTINYNMVTTPVDMTAKDADGWQTVTVDLSAFAYFAEGTTLYGFAIGTTTGQDVKAIEVAEIGFSTEITTEYKTVSFVDKDGNPITAIENQSVAAGKYANAPNATLVPTVEGYEFSYWADANGNQYKFNEVVTEDITLKAVYEEAKVGWEGTTISYSGQDIVDNFTASFERYGNTVNEQKNLTLIDGNAAVEYDMAASKPNKTITMLNAGIRVHAGSKMVVTFKSSAFAEGYTYTQFKMGIAFRGEDAAATINSAATNQHYFQYKSISAGTMSGVSETEFIGFEIAEDGTVTVTCDLYQMSQKFAMTVAEGVDVSYIDAFTFMIVETNSGTSAAKNVSTITYNNIQFVDVQQQIPGAEQVITYSGQQIVDNFKSSYERYGNTVDNQNALTLDNEGNAVADYTTTLKANKVITMLNAGIVVKEGSKMVVTFKSSAFAEDYTYTQFKMGIAFRGEDPATTIHNKANPMHYFQYTKIEAGTLSGSSDTAFISFEVAEDGTVTVTLDLYAMSQASASTVDATTVDVSCIDAFSFMIVETNSATTATPNGCTITFNSIQFVNATIEAPETNS